MNSSKKVPAEYGEPVATVCKSENPDQNASCVKPSRHRRSERGRERIYKLPPYIREQFLLRMIKALGLPEGATDQLPEVFQSEEIKPLKIGIRHELFAAYEVTEKRQMNLFNRAIRTLAAQMSYQLAVLNGTNRYDMDGNPVSEITDKDREFALQKVREIKKKIENARFKAIAEKDNFHADK